MRLCISWSLLSIFSSQQIWRVKPTWSCKMCLLEKYVYDDIPVNKHTSTTVKKHGWTSLYLSEVDYSIVRIYDRVSYFISDGELRIWNFYAVSIFKTFLHQPTNLTLQIYKIYTRNPHFDYRKIPKIPSSYASSYSSRKCLAFFHTNDQVIVCRKHQVIWAPLLL